VFGGFGVRGVAQRKCALGVLVKGTIAASRLTVANDGMKVGDVRRLLSLDGGLGCHLL
jgi:hypothetical protein